MSDGREERKEQEERRRWEEERKTRDDERERRDSLAAGSIGIRADRLHRQAAR